jgi:hypothetical protein
VTVTPETLTLERVRELHDEVVGKIRATKTTESTYDAYFQLTSLQYHCRVVLGEKRAHRGGSRAKSRQVVCGAINARTGAKP